MYAVKAADSHWTAQEKEQLRKEITATQKKKEKRWFYQFIKCLYKCMEFQNTF